MALHGDGNDAHGAIGLQSCHDVPLGTEATLMAYSACEAGVMAHMGPEATHMAYPACEAVVMAHTVRKRCTWRTQLARQLRWPKWGFEATHMAYPASEAGEMAHENRV